MKERDEAPYWPPNPAPHITDWLVEIGPTMGDAVVTEQELVAWQLNSGVELDAWEARTIRRLSTAFLAQSDKARKPDCLAPYTGSEEQIVVRRDGIANRIRAIFAGGRKAD